jgi:hypothetical protein
MGSALLEPARQALANNAADASALCAAAAVTTLMLHVRIDE